MERQITITMGEHEYNRFQVWQKTLELPFATGYFFDSVTGNRCYKETVLLYQPIGKDKVIETLCDAIQYERELAEIHKKKCSELESKLYAAVPEKKKRRFF